MDIYADGACKGSPGKGGWGFYVNEEIQFFGGSKCTTCNRMELTAVIEALKFLKNKVYVIRIITDSRYVRNGILFWTKKWKTNGFRTVNGKAVLNRKLWLEIDELLTNFHATIILVKGHTGIYGNERADQLSKMYYKI